MIGNYYTISEFAEMFDKTRQTLIYYDKIDLFKPSFVNEKGYRLYGPEKVKEFIELVQLLDMGVKLDDLKRIVINCDANFIVGILNKELSSVDDEIKKLKMRKIHLENRRNYYATNYANFELMKPFLKEIGCRHALYEQMLFRTNSTLQTDIDMCFTKVFNKFNNICDFPTVAVGVRFSQYSISNHRYYDDLSTFIMVGKCCENHYKVHTVPGGLYLCMYHYGFHSDPTCLKYLLNYAEENGYEIVGDVYELCIVDNYFLAKHQDLLCIEIPVKKII